MSLISAILLLTQVLAPAAAATGKVYAGFNYGAFWGDQANCKKKDDFLDSFKLAKSLPTPVPFDSARLFTTIQCGTSNDYSSALDAAVETNTSVFLGFWASPGKKGDDNKQQLDNELKALGSAFAKHKEELANLVIGLSVGNEDIYTYENQQSATGVTAEKLNDNVAYVRQYISQSDYAQYMAGRPIGHTDIATYAGHTKGDFVGMNAYPYWHGDTVDKASESYFTSLQGAEKASNGTPIWLTEVGWPFSDSTTEHASSGQANVKNLQKFWTDVGCSLFGKYNTFWFQLIKDSTADQPDWGIVDPKTHQLRLKDISCRDIAGPGNTALPRLHTALSAPVPSSVVPNILTVVSAAPSLDGSTALSAPSSTPPQRPGSNSPALTPHKLTVHVTSTSFVTVARPASQPAQFSLSAPSQSSPFVGTAVYGTMALSTAVSPAPSAPAQQAQTPRTVYVTQTGCVLVADLSCNRTAVPVASFAPGADGKCTTPKTTYRDCRTVTGPAQLGPTAAVTVHTTRTVSCLWVADVNCSGTKVSVATVPAGPDGKCPKPPQTWRTCPSSTVAAKSTSPPPPFLPGGAHPLPSTPVLSAPPFQQPVPALKLAPAPPAAPFQPPIQASNVAPR